MELISELMILIWPIERDKPLTDNSSDLFLCVEEINSIAAMALLEV